MADQWLGLGVPGRGSRREKLETGDFITGFRSLITT